VVVGADDGVRCSGWSSEQMVVLDCHPRLFWPPPRATTTLDGGHLEIVGR
jgi:hypothetical protein